MGSNSRNNSSTQSRPEPASNGDPQPADGLHNYTVRLSDEIVERLEAAASNERRTTGSIQTASSLARTFILSGLNQYERAGGLVISA